MTIYVMLDSVYQLMVRTSDCSKLETCNFLDLDLGRMEEVTRLTNLVKRSISTRNDGYSINKQYFKFMLSILGCLIDQSMMTKVHLSKSSMAEDIMLNFYNHRLSSKVIKYLDHRHIGRFELGIVFPFIRRLTLFESYKTGLTYDWSSMRCVDKIGKLISEQSTSNFKLNVLKKTFKVCFVLIVLEVCINFFEIVIFKARNRRLIRRN